MPKKASSEKTSTGKKLKVVNPNAAGIDIAATEMQVCVPDDRDTNCNRCFGCFTQDLEAIAKWLADCHIETVAMESTGVYWLPLYFKLKEHGVDVVLVNARDVKNLSGRKTDEADAEWLMLLHSYGLLKCSFQPENEARAIRNLTRHRSNLLQSSSREALHMQKAMEQMNLKLGNVISDLLGKSGMAIIKSIIDGNHNPTELAMLAEDNCKATKEEIAKSLEGTWSEDHLFELEQAYDLYNFIQGQIRQCDKQIEMHLIRYRAQLAPPSDDNPPRCKKKIGKKNAVEFDVEKYAFGIWKVNAMAIPGMSAISLLQLIGELGHNFTEKFDSCHSFCSWLNLVPNNKISGGKLLSSKVPKRTNTCGQIFRLCANSLKRNKTTLGYYFRRIQSRCGYSQAIVATAHKIAKIFYTMIKTHMEYDESKTGVNERALLERKIIMTQRRLDKLNGQLSVAIG
ncbi:IS110 family transposase [Bacteroides uniformis]|uniref:IS110 family transposase n=1 Tax=Bacteroides uniformis TaxID=820 RepID=UPI003568F60F